MIDSIPANAAGLVVAAAVFAATIAAAGRLAPRLGMVARPNPIVRSHRAPVPYLGGTALVAAYLALLAGSWWLGGAPPARDVLARSAAALTFVVLGTWDDARPLGPWSKLMIQSLVCAGYLLVTGTPAGPGLAIKLLVLVTLMNAYNIIDVMDGLLCVLAGLAVLGLLAIPASATAHLLPELVLMLIGLGMLFPFNRPPARIYAGDAGSLTLGFLVAAWGLAALGNGDAVAALPIAGLWAVPLLELALVVPARLRQGRSPLQGSPDHFALRLQDQLGWSKWRVLGVAAATGACFAAAPWVAVHLATPVIALYTVACAGAAVIAWLALWRIPPRDSIRGATTANTATVLRNS